MQNAADKLTALFRESPKAIYLEVVSLFCGSVSEQEDPFST